MRVLLVDDDTGVREVTQETLQAQGFEVIPAANVSEALIQIVSNQFDVLVTDLHMPDPGDGFVVAAAMRHFWPSARTVIISGFPDVDAAMQAISLQVDAILTKPVPPAELKQTLLKQRNPQPPAKPRKSVADILERRIDVTLQHWLFRVKKAAELMTVPLSDDERLRHLPEILHSIANRLAREAEYSDAPSPANSLYGTCRRHQNYTVFMLVQEWRILQSCISETIHRNLQLVDFSLLIPDLMLIADEVNSHLEQSLHGYFNAKANDAESGI